MVEEVDGGAGRLTTLGVMVEEAAVGAVRLTTLGVMVEYVAGRTTLGATVALYGYGLRDVGGYDTPDQVDLEMAEADYQHGNQVVMSGGDLLVAYNPDGVAHLIHVESAKDPYQRYEDVDYWLGAGEYGVFGPFELDGWVQGDGRLWVDVDDWVVMLGVVRLGRG
jgi:hypothetical protein